MGAYSRECKLLGQTKAKTPLEKHSDGSVNFSPSQIWELTKHLVKNLLMETECNVKALSVSGMAEAGVLLDSQYEPLYPIIPWYDERRTRSQLKRLTMRLPRQDWYRVTGLYPSAIHTIFKWVWLKEMYPSLWGKGTLWMSVPGYVTHKLCGALQMTDTQAVRTMAFDVNLNRWSTELLNLAELSSGFLPETVPSGIEVGRISQSMSEATGLATGTPVYSGGHDHLCGALACGAVEPSVLMDSFGTSEALTVGTPQPANPEVSRGFAVGPHVLAGSSYLIGGIYSSGGVLSWIRRILGYASFEEMNREVDSVGPAEGPLFIAEVLGAGPPFNVPDASGVFVGLTDYAQRAEIARSVYEGIACQAMMLLDEFRLVLPETPKTVRLVGGSGGTGLWNRIRSTIYGYPIEVPENDDMVTLGAALVAGIGSGVYVSVQEAIADAFQIKKVFEPDITMQATYGELYERYKETVAALRTTQSKGEE